VDYKQEYKTLKKLKSQSVNQAGYVASVAIRVKNEIKGIDAFWQSLAKQTWFNRLEITILDSGSTDGTLDYLDKYNCNIYSIAGSEFSFGPSCNLMFELTTCPYVFFFSGHVILESERLIEDTCQFIKDKNISGYFRQVPNANFGSSIYDDAFLKHRFPQYPSALPVQVGSKNSFSNAASVMNRQHWEQVKFQNVIFGEDGLWASEVLAKNGEIYYFHTLNVAHSHNDTPAEVIKRVRMAAMVKYPNGTPLPQLLFIFAKVFTAIFVNSRQFTPSIKFAKAHTLAYTKLKKQV